MLHIFDHSIRIAQGRIGTAFPDELPNDITYNLEDHLNNSTHTVSDTGAFLSKEEYYPFGETAYGSYSKKRYRFNGKELDSESGLYYYGMRYYAPWTCRFINVDPIWSDYPFYTPYQYAGNKPINARDIDGLEEEGGSPQAASSSSNQDTSKSGTAPPASDTLGFAERYTSNTEYAKDFGIDIFEGPVSNTDLSGLDTAAFNAQFYAAEGTGVNTGPILGYSDAKPTAEPETGFFNFTPGEFFDQLGENFNVMGARLQEAAPDQISINAEVTLYTPAGATVLFGASATFDLTTPDWYNPYISTTIGAGAGGADNIIEGSASVGFGWYSEDVSDLSNSEKRQIIAGSGEATSGGIKPILLDIGLFASDPNKSLGNTQIKGFNLGISNTSASFKYEQTRTSTWTW